MDLDNIPDKTGNRYPCKIGLAISLDAKTKLDFLRNEKGKNTAALLRLLIDNFLKDVSVSN